LIIEQLLPTVAAFGTSQRKKGEEVFGSEMAEIEILPKLEFFTQVDTGIPIVGLEVERVAETPVTQTIPVSIPFANEVVRDVEGSRY